MGQKQRPQPTEEEKTIGQSDQTGCNRPGKLGCFLQGLHLPCKDEKQQRTGQGKQKHQDHRLDGQRKSIGSRVAGKPDGCFDPGEKAFSEPEDARCCQAGQNEDRRGGCLGNQQLAGGEPWAGSDQRGGFARQIVKILPSHCRRAAHPEQAFGEKGVKRGNRDHELTVEGLKLGEQAKGALIGDDNLVEQLPSTGQERFQFLRSRAEFVRSNALGQLGGIPVNIVELLPLFAQLHLQQASLSDCGLIAGDLFAQKTCAGKRSP